MNEKALVKMVNKLRAMPDAVCHYSADELERLAVIIARLPKDKDGNLFKRYGVIGEPEPATPFELTES